MKLSTTPKVTSDQHFQEKCTRYYTVIAGFQEDQIWFAPRELNAWTKDIRGQDCRRKMDGQFQVPCNILQTWFFNYIEHIYFKSMNWYCSGILNILRLVANNCIEEASDCSPSTSFSFKPTHRLWNIFNEMPSCQLRVIMKIRGFRMRGIRARGMLRAHSGFRVCAKPDLNFAYWIFCTYFPMKLNDDSHYVASNPFSTLFLEKRFSL